MYISVQKPFQIRLKWFYCFKGVLRSLPTSKHYEAQSTKRYEAQSTIMKHEALADTSTKHQAFASSKNVLYLAQNAKKWKDTKSEIRNCPISLQQQWWTGLMFLPEKYIKTALLRVLIIA